LERALKLHPALLGINNRNLKTLEVDLTTTERLAPQVPTEWTIVCESGIYTSHHISRMKEIGIKRFLVGESLMREPNVVSATRNLLGLPG
jgi:indole-3-glycerol phosphate synthase